MPALEADRENRNQSQLFKEQLLYNLWKVSNNWLELKSGKAQKADASGLSFDARSTLKICEIKR